MGLPKLTIKLQLNSLGLIEVVQAIASFEEVVEVNYTERVRINETDDV